MTPKIKEFADRMYPHDSNVLPRPVLIEGILIGAEFAEWVIISGCKADPYQGWVLDGKTYTTSELLDIFITEKMKENESSGL